MHLIRKKTQWILSIFTIHTVWGFKLEQLNKQYIQPRFHAAQY